MGQAGRGFANHQLGVHRDHRTWSQLSVSLNEAQEGSGSHLPHLPQRLSHRSQRRMTCCRKQHVIESDNGNVARNLESCLAKRADCADG